MNQLWPFNTTKLTGEAESLGHLKPGTFDFPLEVPLGLHIGGYEFPVNYVVQVIACPDRFDAAKKMEGPGPTQPLSSSAIAKLA